MWIKLNIDDLLPLKEMKDAVKSPLDLPSNMEYMEHPNGSIEFRFYYDSHGEEPRETTVLNSGAATIGKYTGRVFVVRATGIAGNINGLRELLRAKHGTVRKHVLNIETCIAAIEKHKKELGPKAKPAMIRITRTQQLEKALNVLPTNTLEEVVTILEIAVNLNFTDATKLKDIIELTLTRRK